MSADPPLPTRVSDAEVLAQRFHDIYEELAPTFGYETRSESRKPWGQIPEKNRALMVAVAARILEGWWDESVFLLSRIVEAHAAARSGDEREAIMEATVWLVRRRILPGFGLGDPAKCKVHAANCGGIVKCGVCGAPTYHLHGSGYCSKCGSEGDVSGFRGSDWPACSSCKTKSRSLKDGHCTACRANALPAAPDRDSLARVLYKAVYPKSIDWEELDARERQHLRAAAESVADAAHCPYDVCWLHGANAERLAKAESRFALVDDAYCQLRKRERGLGEDRDRLANDLSMTSALVKVRTIERDGQMELASVTLDQLNNMRVERDQARAEVESLKDELERAKRVWSEAEKDYRIQHRRASELEAEVERLNAEEQTLHDATVSDLAKQIAEWKRRACELQELVNEVYEGSGMGSFQVTLAWLEKARAHLESVKKVK